MSVPTQLTTEEAQAITAIALMAALADGRTASDEREQIRSLFDSLAADNDMPALPALHQRVILRQASARTEADRLRSQASRRMAFEIAVCVADADGAITPAEQAFLDDLESHLGLDHAEAIAFERDADTIALAPTPDAQSSRLDPGELLEPAQAHPIQNQPAPANPADAEADRIVLRYAILNGALELLPQNLATMAILPLQTRMVYAIGKQYGHALGAGHIKEFIATLGLGATSQMLENFARKALGKLTRQTLGKTAGKVAKAATGPMMTFATTFAIGRVAKAYYAGGRSLRAVDLRAMFERDVAQGRAVYEQHRPQIEASARSLDPAKVIDLVRGRTDALHQPFSS